MVGFVDLLVSMLLVNYRSGFELGLGKKYCEVLGLAASTLLNKRLLPSNITNNRPGTTDVSTLRSFLIGFSGHRCKKKANGESINDEA